MSMHNRTRSRIQNLVDAIVRESDDNPSGSDIGWAVIRNPTSSPDGEDNNSGYSLWGREARLYLEASGSLEIDSAVEHLTRHELNEALDVLVQDLISNKEQFKRNSERRSKVSEFVSEISKPHEKYEVAFAIEWVKFPIEPIIVGGVHFREFTQQIAVDWGYETANDLFKEMLDEIIGHPVGIVTVYAGTCEKAAERAQALLESALNALRIACIGSAKGVALWDEQLLQRRGGGRVIKKIEPNTGAMSIGGGRTRTPMTLDFTGDLADSTKEFAKSLDSIYNSTMPDKFRNAILRGVEWIGMSITREIYDHKIVDLCTALEAMLSTIDDGRKGEALSLRYLLLAIALDETFFDLRLIHDLYLRRSNVIHGAALGECGKQDYLRLRAIAIEVLGRIIKLNDSQGPFNRPVDFIRFLESKEYLQQAIEWLEKWQDSSMESILKYAKNKLPD